MKRAGGHMLSCYAAAILILLLNHPNACNEAAAAADGDLWQQCNGTTGECMMVSDDGGDGGGEFLMEYEVSERILSGNGKNPIVFPSNKKPPFCNAKTYMNCIKKALGKDSRECDYYNRCLKKTER